MPPRSLTTEKSLMKFDMSTNDLSYLGDPVSQTRGPDSLTNPSLVFFPFFKRSSTLKLSNHLLDTSVGSSRMDHTVFHKWQIKQTNPKNLLPTENEQGSVWLGVKRNSKVLERERKLQGTCRLEEDSDWSCRTWRTHILVMTCRVERGLVPLCPRQPWDTHTKEVRTYP